jgi:hypothetical protein
MIDLTKAFCYIHHIPGRGDVMSVNMDNCPNVRLKVGHKILANNKFYQIRGLELQGKKIHGLLIKEIPDPRSFLEIACLDPKRTHKMSGGLNCRMRLAQHPRGHWYCIDCGLEIMSAVVTMEEKK